MTIVIMIIIWNNAGRFHVHLMNIKQKTIIEKFVFYSVVQILRVKFEIIHTSLGKLSVKAQIPSLVDKCLSIGLNIAHACGQHLKQNVQCSKSTRWKCTSVRLVRAVCVFSFLDAVLQCALCHAEQKLYCIYIFQVSTIANVWSFLCNIA